MRLGVLASGSRGNALVVEHNGCMVFFAAGLFAEGSILKDSSNRDSEMFFQRLFS